MLSPSHLIKDLWKSVARVEADFLGATQVWVAEAQRLRLELHAKAHGVLIGPHLYRFSKQL